jgi:hypothetical protein
MRIAILTSARSGSTSLFHLIEAHLISKKYITISEPFNKDWRNKVGFKIYDVDFFKQNKKIFIKTFVSEEQKPNTFINSDKNYWDWFFNYFDKVIILDRKDKTLQSESLTYHLKKEDPYSWQKKQYYNISNITKESIEETKNRLLKDSEKMHSFANNKHPIYYFEDIFIKKDRKIIENLFNYIDLKLNDVLYEKYVLSDTFKVRLEEVNNNFKKLI